MNTLIPTHSTFSNFGLIAIFKNFQIAQQRTRLEHFKIPLLHIREVK